MKDFIINNPSNLLVENSTNKILKKSKPLIFHKKLRNYFKTPLYELSGLSNNLNIANLFIKDESQRFGLNAFKG